MLKKCHLVSLCFFLMSIPIVGCMLEPLSRVGSVNCEGAKSITTIIDGKAETFKCAEFDDDGECSVYEVGDKRVEPKDFHNEEWTYWANSLGNEKCPDEFRCKSDSDPAQCVLMKCDGKEVDFSTSNQHCGRCGNRCPEDAPQCKDGKCSVICDGIAVDPQRDDDYCGAKGDCLGNHAGEKCKKEDGEYCDAGKCVQAAKRGMVNCGDEYINPDNDPRYCGAKDDCTEGEKCTSPNPLCSRGRCVSTCVGGQIVCDGRCVDPQKDNSYCGATGDCQGTNVGEKCDSGKVCSEGQCGITCVSGQILCNGQCIDPTTDNRYCGAKDNCSDDNAGAKCKDGEVCSGSKCGVTCVSGQIICGGKCVDPKIDNTYCGAKEDCSATNAGEACVSGKVCSEGKCGITCVSGQVVCNSQCIDPKSDNRYCGATADCMGSNAGEKCASGEVCSGGTCGASCLSGQILCNGQCIDPDTDNRYCGATGECQGTNAGEKCDSGKVCSGGTCGASCLSGQILCNGQCIDPESDNRYCGATADCTGSNAGEKCASGEVCSGGTCGASCLSGQILCNGQCIDPQTDNRYCGAKDNCSGANAGKKCDSGQVCSGGSCGVTCVSGQILCNGQCIDPKTDNRYCGAKDNCSGANVGKKCGSGQVCSGGACGVTCVSGQLLCNGQCIDPDTDNRYCGASSNCKDANVGKKCKDGEVCSAGKCGTSCLSSQVLCGGKCIVPETDNAYCGAKAGCTGATKCRDGEVCSVGKCGVTCVSGQILCNGQCIDPKTDNRYCGAKDNCSGANAGSKCKDGEVCSVGKCGVTCVAGQIVCGGRCIDPSSDNSYCGVKAGCTGATKCSGVTPLCVDGKCVSTCVGNQIVCGGRCVDPSSDNSYCGAKGVCNNDSASSSDYRGATCRDGRVCSNGICALTCETGKIICDNRCVDPRSDNLYCGAKGKCNNTSPSSNDYKGATCRDGRVCSNGICALTCETGKIICDNRCVDPNADNLYCGAKGKCNSASVSDANYRGQKCAEGTKCTGGVCKISCVSGQIVCGNECIDPKTNPYYCGATGNCQGANSGTDCTKSSTNKLCAAGKCSSSCPTGQTQCAGYCIDMNATNVLLCDGNKIKCKDGYGNCDNDVANGCEANTISDNAHCGICGYACTTGNVENSQSVQCSNGVCRATSCARGYVLDDGKCVASDTLDCCGKECKNCYEIYPYMKEGKCEPSGCVLVSCIDGYMFDSMKNKCVEIECSKSADCGNSGSCIGGKCKCGANPACSGQKPICDSGNCVECTEISHCSAIQYAEQRCNRNACSPICIPGYHKDKTGRCLENSDSSCGDREGSSVTSCALDTPRCDIYNGRCVECFIDDHCRFIMPIQGASSVFCRSDHLCDVQCANGYDYLGIKKCKQSQNPYQPIQ